MQDEKAMQETPEPISQADQGPTEENLRGEGIQTKSRWKAKKPPPVEPKNPERQAEETRKAEEMEELSARMEIAGLLSRRLIFQPMLQRLDREQTKQYSQEITQAVISSADEPRHRKTFERARVRLIVIEWLPKGTAVLMRGPGEVDVVRLET